MDQGIRRARVMGDQKSALCSSSLRWASWLKLMPKWKRRVNHEEKELFSHFASLGLEADEIVSRKPGWIRNNDRLRKQNIAHEAADCNMMLSVFMESYARISPDDALREKMALKLGCKTEDLDKVLGVQQG